MLQYITWNIDREIFWFIRWYGLLFAAAFYFGYILFTRFFKKEGVKIEVLDKLTIYMMIGTILGARIGHCLFYEPEYYLANPLEILFIWHGGLASHGAAFGILAALYFFAKKEKQPFLWIVDRIVITVALSGFFIRMGNLMNSEIYGVQTSLPWGFIFVRDNQTLPMHPTQIYEALSYLAIFGILYKLYYKYDGKPANGLLFGLFLVLTFSMRFLIEFIKNPQVDFEQNMVLDMGQWLSIPFVLGGCALLYYVYNKKQQPIK